ncbi:MAG TPA: RimK/LysX family protein [Candidatus Saccharimonadales bacterium]
MEDADNRELTVIGRAERVDLPKQGINRIPAKTDTGADSSSIWGTNIHEAPEGLECTLFGPGSEFYTGEKLFFAPGEYEVTRVANSFGHREFRYRIKLAIRVKGRLVNGRFTLADRSRMTYPILLGRRLLSGKFVVDVKSGEPLLQEERAKRQDLKKDIQELKEIGEIG